MTSLTEQEPRADRMDHKYYSPKRVKVNAGDNEEKFK
jgi:hypothetical protein